MYGAQGGAGASGTAGPDHDEDFRAEGFDDFDDFDDLERALYSSGREAGVGAPGFMDESVVRARARAVAAGRSFHPWARR